jgi:hypothetical protein
MFVRRTADYIETLGGTMLSPATLAAYPRDGLIVLPDILTPAKGEALRRVTDAFVARVCAVAANDEIYDLEESHSSDEPRVRRIKTPHLHDPEYAHGGPASEDCRGAAGSVGNGSFRYR